MVVHWLLLVLSWWFATLRRCNASIDWPKGKCGANTDTNLHIFGSIFSTVYQPKTKKEEEKKLCLLCASEISLSLENVTNAICNASSSKFIAFQTAWWPVKQSWAAHVQMYTYIFVCIWYAEGIYYGIMKCVVFALFSTLFASKKICLLASFGL